MTTAPATIVSCLYGNAYNRFVNQWAASIAQLNTKPADIIVATDRTVAERGYHISHAQAVINECTWRHPQAFHLQQAIEAAQTEWVWILDMDDQALPDALDGIDQVQADVWQMGYERSDGHVHIPPQLTAAEYLTEKGNHFTACSAIRTDAFRDAGGFPDVAFQDFGLWRRLALIGASFQSSGRAHYRYNLHENTRTVLELVPDMREQHMAEMIVSEAANG